MHWPTEESFMLVLTLSLRPDHHRAIKEGTISMNRDCIYDKACILSNKIHDLSHYFIMLDDPFKLIMKRKLSTDFLNL